jgi:isopentenyl-diphosphate delta-isomerase
MLPKHLFMTVMIPAWIDGVLTPVEKLEVHQRGLKHKAVSVFAICRGDILIQRRALGKYHTPGLWANTCCTHPNWNEPDVDCANRRLIEELGLHTAANDYRGRVEYRADVGAGLLEHEVVEIFVTTFETRPAIAPNPDEVMDTAWSSYADLVDEVADNPTKFTPWLKIYLDEFAEQIFKSDFS